MSRTASQWNVSVAAPDLSKVGRLTEATAKDSAYAEFYDGLIKAQRERMEARAADKAETESAKQDLGNDPESPGFWSKLGQGALEGASHVIDIISRPLYGVANAAEYVFDQNEDAPNALDRISPMGANAVNSLDDWNFGDFGGVLKAGWEGFSGKDKTEFIEIIAKNAERDPAKTMHDNPWYQAGVGLAGDIMGDPLTYVGVGLVTKPVNAIKGVEQTSRWSKAADEIAKEVERLKVTTKVEVSKGVEKEVPLSREQVYTMLTGDPLAVGKGSKALMTRSAQRTARMRHYLDAVDTLKKDLRRNPHFDESEVESLSKAMDDLHAESKRLLDQHATEAFAKAGEKFDMNPKKWKARRGETATKHVEDSLTLAKASRAFKVEGNRRLIMRNGGKVDPNRLPEFDDMLGDAWKHDPRVSDTFRGSAYDIVDSVVKKNDRYKALKQKLYGGKKFAYKKNSKGEWERTVWDDAASSETGLKWQVERAQRDLETFAPGTKEYKAAQSELARLMPVYNRTWDEINKIYGSAFIKLLDADINGAKNFLKPEQIERLTGLREALDDVNERIAAVGDNAPEVHTADDFYVGPERNPDMSIKTEEVTDLNMKDGKFGPKTSKVAKADKGDKRNPNAKTAGGPGVENSAQALKQERNEILREMEEVIGPNSKEWAAGDVLPKPESLPDDFDLEKNYKRLFKVDEHGDLALREDLSDEVKPWATEVLNNIETQVSEHVNKSIAGYRRRMREAHEMSRPENIKKAFGGPGGKVAKITFKGREVLKSEVSKIMRSKDPKDKELQEAIEKAVTDADRAAYREGITKSAKNEGKVLDDPLTGSRTGDVHVKVNPEDTLEAVARKGAEDVVRHGSPAAPSLFHVTFDRLFKSQHGMDIEAAAIARKQAERAGKAKARDFTRSIPPKVREGYENAARKASLSAVGKLINEGRLTAIQDKAVDLKGVINPTQKEVDEVEEAYQAAVRKERYEYQMEASAKARKNPHNFSNAAKTQKELAALKAEHAQRLDALKEMKEEAVAARTALADALNEQYLIDLIEDAPGLSRTAVKIKFGGKMVGFGSKHTVLDPTTGKYIRDASFYSPRILTAATEKLGGIEILQKTWNAWSQAFSPASKLSPELNKARLTAQGRVNDVIKLHLDEVFNAFRKYTPEQSRAVLAAIKNRTPQAGNVDKELYDTAHKFLDDFVYYTAGHASVGGESLKLTEINKYLPEEFKFLDFDGKSMWTRELNSVDEILEHMRRLSPSTDVMKVIWNLRIATEKAMAEKGLRYVIAKSFGVKRVLTEDIGDLASQERHNLIEALNKKFDWTTAEGFGEKYYFSPEAAKEIKKLTEMMKPENAQMIVRGYDKILRAWKSTVTVYNPGYYSRNGIGEYIMGTFDGVSHPRWYKKAGAVLGYGMPDEVNQAIKHLDPFTNYKGPRGKDKILRLRSGKELTKEEVWMLYHEHNLKSGFVSTEYNHYFPSAGQMRATAVGQTASKINDAARHVGEKFEDYFRLAHFMNRLARSNYRNLDKAADEAAQFVRKYHFDYTDFTPHEKAVWMRIFPFYKWTRKAFPLMAGMLFTNPAKVNFYPKAMSALSAGRGGTDPLTDTNGLLPNYEEVTPEWMRALMAYPMGEDAEGNQSYMNVATPAFDIYKMMQNPVSAMIGMGTPVVKTPFEQATGETLDPAFKMELDSGEKRKDHLARTTPGTGFLNKIWDGRGGDSALVEPGKTLPAKWDETLASFLTGLGFYENNEKRQKGEEFRRAVEGK